MAGPPHKFTALGEGPHAWAQHRPAQDAKPLEKVKWFEISIAVTKHETSQLHATL